MITLYLYGFLKEKFGEKFELEAKSPAEAIGIMEANFPGEFRKSFIEGNFHVVRGKGLFEGECDTEDTLWFLKDSDIHISPEITGSKAGLLQTIIGAVLLVIAYLFPIASPYLIPLGLSLMIGGIIQMLTPIPEIGDLDMGTSKDRRASYIFGGSENLVLQGVPVPVVYGEVEVGSVAVAMTLAIEDI